eukprot:SAG11_NODE_1598_length_4610_cov_2.897362_2_plen_190_part_00
MDRITEGWDRWDRARPRVLESKCEGPRLAARRGKLVNSSSCCARPQCADGLDARPLIAADMGLHTSHGAARWRSFLLRARRTGNRPQRLCSPAAHFGALLRRCALSELSVLAHLQFLARIASSCSAGAVLQSAHCVHSSISCLRFRGQSMSSPATCGTVSVRAHSCRRRAQHSLHAAADDAAAGRGAQD